MPSQCTSRHSAMRTTDPSVNLVPIIDCSGSLAQTRRCAAGCTPQHSLTPYCIGQPLSLCLTPSLQSRGHVYVLQSQQLPMCSRPAARGPANGLDCRHQQREAAPWGQEAADATAVPPCHSSPGTPSFCAGPGHVVARAGEVGSPRAFRAPARPRLRATIGSPPGDVFCFLWWGSGKQSSAGHGSGRRTCLPGSATGVTRAEGAAPH